MAKVGDWIKENCDTVGVGALTLVGADEGFTRFGDIFKSVEQVWYVIIDGINAESGVGTFNGVSQITRDNIQSTLVGGVFDDTSPSPIYLNGEAVVACAFTAASYAEMDTLLADLESMAITNANNITANASNISQNATNISTNTNAIDIITSAVSDNISDIATNAGDIATNTADITTINSDLLYRESSVSALETGGNVSQNGNTAVLVLAGTGEVIDSFSTPGSQTRTSVSWAEESFDLLANIGMPVVTGLGYTEIGVDANGDILAYPNGLSYSQRKIVIKLALVEYVDQVITRVSFAPIVSSQIGNVVLDMLDFIPVSNKISGLVIRPTTVGDLSLWRDVGELFYPGANYENSLSNQNVRQLPSAGAIDTPVSYSLVSYNNGNTVLGGTVSIVPADAFEEDGAGNVGALGNGKTVIHYLYESPTGGSFFFSYGQIEYDTYAEAINNLFSDRASHLTPIELGSFILLGQMVVSKDATTWDGIVAAVYPINSSTSSGSAGGSAGQAVNISYNDTYAIGSNVQVAVDALAGVKMSATQKAGMDAANAPSGTNALATINDLGSALLDLDYTPSPTDGVVTNSAGTDATITTVDGTNAGLMIPADKAKLDATSGINTGDQNLTGYATIASPVFTGVPKAPTPANNNVPTALATTQYVADSVSDISGLVLKTSRQALADVANALTVSGTTVTIARGDGSTDEIITQDTIVNEAITLTGDAQGSGTSSIEVIVRAATDISLTGTVVEEVYEMAGLALDPANGTMQYKTLSANTTFTDNLSAGESLTLRLVNGDSYTVNYPTITWVTGSAPDLTAEDELVFWKESTILYGNYVGSLAGA